jgi:Transposase IS66 family
LERHEAISVELLRLIRPKYACRACQDGVVQAPAPPRALTGGIATTRLMAHVAVSKFAWNLPLKPPAVVYVYAEGRGHKEIRAQLAGFRGLVQVDGYAGYNGLTGKARQPGPITLAFCLAHARRKFTDLHKQTGSAFTAEVIERFGRICAIEAEIRGTSAAERLAVRQALSAADGRAEDRAGRGAVRPLEEGKDRRGDPLYPGALVGPDAVP